MEVDYMKRLLLLSLVLLLGVPVHSQIVQKVTDLSQTCRLVRGHAHMLEQMANENEFNQYVARAHFTEVERNIKEMELMVRDIDLSLTAPQKNRVKSDIDKLYEICNATKPIVASVREIMDADEINLPRLRVLSSRIVRNLKDALDAQKRILEKL
jgi:hypothetical protein